MWVPKFQYPAAGTVLALATPMRHWQRRQHTIGGLRESASGTARAARTIRRDYLLDLTLRVDEAELAAFELFIAWAQDNPATAFTFWPDVAVPGTSYACFLIAPVHGEEFTAPRDGEFASMLNPAITLRRTDGAAWPLVWYPD